MVRYKHIFKKLCNITLKTSWVQNKPKLDNISKSYLHYYDLEGLHNSLDYLEGLQKNLFVMIWQFGPPIFFVTFTFTNSLWDRLIKASHITCYKIKSPPKIENL
jgi:hypothetical protein